jgi:hypothetical protein
MMNKRGFLLGAASTVAATPQVLAAAAPASPGLAADGLPLLGHGPGLADWQAYLGQRFALTDGQQHWVVRLDRADALATASQAVRTEQFLLGFSSPDQQAIPAGLHGLRHANGQGTLIHLAGSGGQALRAEFNLLRQPV